MNSLDSPIPPKPTACPKADATSPGWAKSPEAKRHEAGVAQAKPAMELQADAVRDAFAFLSKRIGPGAMTRLSKKGRKIKLGGLLANLND